MVGRGVKEASQTPPIEGIAKKTTHGVVSVEIGVILVCVALRLSVGHAMNLDIPWRGVQRGVPFVGTKDTPAVFAKRPFVAPAASRAIPAETANFPPARGARKRGMCK